MAEENLGRASVLAHSVRRMFMSAAASTKAIDGGIPAIGIASSIIEAIDAIDPIDLPLPQERALLRCRAIAATMPLLPHNEAEQAHLALLAESGAICASELLRLVETARDPGRPHKPRLKVKAKVRLDIRRGRARGVASASRPLRAGSK
jgi:hypothetical protein